MAEEIFKPADITARREALRWSKRRLGKEAGISGAWVGQVERGGWQGSASPEVGLWIEMALQVGEGRLAKHLVALVKEQERAPRNDHRRMMRTLVTSKH
jgi:transcriptional regulator with XRE-family HTH domain